MRTAVTTTKRVIQEIKTKTNRKAGILSEKKRPVCEPAKINEHHTYVNSEENQESVNESPRRITKKETNKQIKQKSNTVCTHMQKGRERFSFRFTFSISVSAAAMSKKMAGFDKRFDGIRTKGDVLARVNEMTSSDATTVLNCPRGLGFPENESPLA